MTIPHFCVREVQLNIRYYRDNSADAHLVTRERVILSGMGAAQGQGTRRGPASPQKLWSLHRAPACLARRRAALEGRSQAVYAWEASADLSIFYEF